jgi:hypothetical protein
VSGYPGATARLLTVSQLKYQRDIGNPSQRKIWETLRGGLERYSKLGDEQFRQASAGLRGYANSLKRLAGQQDGLLNPRQFAKKVAEEKDIRDRLAQRPELDKQFAPAWTNIATAYESLPAMSKRLSFSTLAVSRLGTLTSQIVTYSIEKGKPDAVRYPEYSDARLDALKRAIISPGPIYSDMEVAVLTAWFDEARKELGNNDPFIKAAFGDADTGEVVGRAVRDTKLTDPEVRKALSKARLTLSRNRPTRSSRLHGVSNLSFESCAIGTRRIFETSKRRTVQRSPKLDSRFTARRCRPTPIRSFD